MKELIYSTNQWKFIEQITSLQGNERLSSCINKSIDLDRGGIILQKIVFEDVDLYNEAKDVYQYLRRCSFYFFPKSTRETYELTEGEVQEPHKIPSIFMEKRGMS